MLTKFNDMYAASGLDGSTNISEEFGNKTTYFENIFDQMTLFNMANEIYPWISCSTSSIKTLRPRQNGHFPDDSFKCIFLNENVWISINISPKFVPKGPINNIPALVQIMAWSWTGNKPLYEVMMA